MTVPGPLSDLRVVALEHSVAGPLCTRILRELGADVIKVERPGGDFSRHWDSNVNGDSAQFWWLNRGKRSIELDLKDSEGVGLFRRLLDSADVLVQNLSPGATERFGLDRQLSVRSPNLIVCSISGFGADSPARDRKAYDMLIQAETGIIGLTGTEERPTRVGVSLCDVGTGLYAAIMVLAAIQQRGRSGLGCYLDVPMFDVGLEFVGPMLLSHLNADLVYPRLPDRHHAIAPYGIFRCRDGRSLVIAVEQDTEWRTLCTDFLGAPLLAEDPRFATNERRVANRDETTELVADVVRGMDFEQAVGALSRIDIAFGAVNSMREVGEHPVSVAGSLLDSVAVDGASVLALSGLAGRLFSTGTGEERPPLLGEHSAEIIASLAENVRVEAPNGG